MLISKRTNCFDPKCSGELTRTEHALDRDPTDLTAHKGITGFWTDTCITCNASKYTRARDGVVNYSAKTNA